MKKNHLLLLVFALSLISLKAQNYALNFSSATQYVSIGATDIPAPWTAEMWIQKTAASDYSSIMTSAAYKLNLETWSSGGKVGITQKGTADYAFNYIMPVANWTHLAYTCDGINTYIYVNGVLTATINAAIKAPMQLLNNNTEGAIAIVDEVRIWNFAKTADDVIAEMYHPVNNSATGLVGYWRFDDKAIKATDSSTAAHHATIVGATYVANDNNLFTNTIPAMVLNNVICSHENEFIVNPNSTNQEVLCIKVNTSGSINPKVVSSIRITPTGTTNLTDVTNVKVFYTGRSNIFATSTTYGTTATISANMTFSGNQSLKEGTNYFWVTYDVTANAKTGDKLDATCASISVQGMSDVVPTINNPDGNRNIQSSVPLKIKDISIIPKPVSLDENAGAFTLASSTQIVVENATNAEGVMLADVLKKSTGFSFPIQTGGNKTNNISLEILPSYNSTIGAEGYLLNVTSNGITIKANTKTGVFYGTQTLRQLLPLEINSLTIVNGISWICPNVAITDYPRFVWRGLMLDVSRHFFSVAEVKRNIDILAMNKMNIFHWHLIDSEGFRIEIKSHPELTSIGAVRSLCPSENTPFDQGYYTQDEIRDVVAYALARNVNIEPEIESPGHAAAWLAALPGMACTSVANGTQHVACSNSANGGVNNNLPNTICMGKNYTYQIMGDVINEITSLFPFKYVHIGGDEANHNPWTTCTDCQKLMNDSTTTAFPLDNNNLHNVQTFYLRRIQRLLAAKGKKVVGWTEMGQLDKNSVLQDWIGGADAAIKNGNETIYSNSSSVYLDSYQGSTAEPQTQGWMGPVPINKVYNYNPPTSSLSADKKALVLGIETCLWSEFNHDNSILEYRLLPRLYAAAEASWTDESLKNLNEFQMHLYDRIGELDLLKYNYCPIITPASTTTSITGTCSGSVVLDAGFGADSYYWNDATNSSSNSITVTKSGVYKVYGNSKGTIIQRAFNVTIPNPATQPNISTSVSGANTTYTTTGDAAAYKWYDSQIGGNLLNTGNSYTAPSTKQLYITGEQMVASNVGLSFLKTGYVDFGNVSALNSISSFTFESWVKVDAWSGWAYIFNKELSNTSRIGLQLGGSEGELYCFMGNGANAYANAVGLTSLGKWFHVAMVYNGNGATNADRLKLYFNGVPVTLAFTGTISSTTPSNTASLQYGHPTDGIVGKLAESRFWSTPRTASEILSNINSDLIGTESNLLLYTKLNEGSGLIASDSKGSLNGVLKNPSLLSWNNSDSDFKHLGCESERWNVGLITSQDHIKMNNNKILAYPNPNNGSFTIEITSDNDSNISIQWYDLSGRMLDYKPSNTIQLDNQSQFNYKSIPKGIYLLRILTQNESNDALKVVVK